MTRLFNEIQETFLLFDKDKNGKIDASELGSIIRALDINPTDTELMDIMNEMDGDGNGSIEYDEFVAMLSTKFKGSEMQDDLKESFRLFDKDGDGYISVTELRHIMHSIDEDVSENDLNYMLREADIDGDGQINYEEFVKILSQSQ